MAAAAIPAHAERPASLQRVLAVLPGLPEPGYGGGIVLYELLAWLAEQVGPGREVAVALPMAPAGQPILEDLRADPVLTRVKWHPLPEKRAPGIVGRLGRMLGSLPSDMAKAATAENVARLETVRATMQPTVELAVSSWALAAYRGQAFAEGTRLFMVNVDHEIVRQAMPAVLSARAVGKALVRKLACAVDRPKVLAMSRRALATAARVGAISPADVTQLNRLGGRSDVGYLPPLMRPRMLDRSGAVPGSVLVTTNFSYSPNVESLSWFLREVWPRVSGAARLTVAGLDEGGQLAALCQRHERVNYVGWLDPARLDDAFAKTALAVNPTRSGSGFQVKLLDAIARGVPIVSTAWSNKLGPAIPSSDAPAELAGLITERLDPGRTTAFDYAAFYREACAAWERFLFA